MESASVAQIVKKVYVPETESLAALDQGAATSPQPVVYTSWKQIMKRVYDSSGKLRTVRA
jgi:hypothetical protein